MPAVEARGIPGAVVGRSHCSARVRAQERTVTVAITVKLRIDAVSINVSHCVRESGVCQFLPVERSQCLCLCLFARTTARWRAMIKKREDNRNSDSWFGPVCPGRGGRTEGETIVQQVRGRPINCRNLVLGAYARGVGRNAVRFDLGTSPNVAVWDLFRVCTRSKLLPT